MIAEDQTVVRQALVALLELELGARNRAEAVQFAEQKGWL
jgi:hypothetical protein